MYRKDIDDFYNTSQRLIAAVKESDEYDEQDIDSSFNNVMEIIRRKRQYVMIKKFYLWSGSVAASVIVFLFSLLYLFPVRNAIDVELLEQVTASYDDEIELSTKEQVFSLDNHAVLKYETDGRANLKKFILETKENVNAGRDGLNRLLVPYGKTANLILSDGTKVYVNSGSAIMYPSCFQIDKREILVDGEVYLEVAKKENIPFIVKTRDFNINVLGTSFNVSSYKNDDSSSVVLLTGSVRVDTKSGKEFLITPNQQFCATKDNMLIRDVNASEYIGWIDGLLFIHNQPLSVILHKLERRYGCSIQCRDELLSMKIDGKLELKSDLQLVIENLCYLLSIDFSITQDGKKYFVNLK